MVTASYDDQEYLGLEIFEVGNQAGGSRQKGLLDLVFDPSGAREVPLY
jgi:hypothetical protein